MSEIQRIRINEQHKQEICKKYGQSTKEELLTIFGGDKNNVQGLANPENQAQSEGEVGFTSREISQGVQELAEEGHATKNIGFVHNHNRDSNHGFGFSDADLDTADKLYNEHGIDRMGLVMNGKTLSDGNVGVQHMVIANHEGELHDLEGEQGEGKVMTTFVNEHGELKEVYSDSIEEAEKKELEIMMLKETLNDGQEDGPSDAEQRELEQLIYEAESIVELSDMSFDNIEETLMQIEREMNEIEKEMEEEDLQATAEELQIIALKELLFADTVA